MTMNIFSSIQGGSNVWISQTLLVQFCVMLNEGEKPFRGNFVGSFVEIMLPIKFMSSHIITSGIHSINWNGKGAIFSGNTHFDLQNRNHNASISPLSVKNQIIRLNILKFENTFMIHVILSSVPASQYY